MSRLIILDGMKLRYEMKLKGKETNENPTLDFTNLKVSFFFLWLIIMNRNYRKVMNKCLWL